MQELLARMRPPHAPNDAFGPDYPDLMEITHWNKLHAASIVAGLLTQPDLQIHAVRLDWLQRLILSHANGKKKVRQRDLLRAFNVGLTKARVSASEDPIEDLFCEQLVTEIGAYRIFSGQWDSAAAYTRTVIEAFLMLPDGARKSRSLTAVTSLLALSEALCDRAKVTPSDPVDGNPGGPIALPTDAILQRLANRVTFTNKDLAGLGIDPDTLNSFVLPDQYLTHIGEFPIGETPLELHPLLRTKQGIIVVSPANLSIAARANLIYAATSGGFAKSFDAALMIRQEEATEIGHFWPIRGISLSAPNAFGMRASVFSYDNGSWLHVLQMPPMTGDFPREGFGALRELPPAAYAFLKDDIERFWKHCAEQPNCRFSATVILLSGWGGAYAFDPPIDEAKVPANWQLIPLTFADATTLAMLEDGHFTDISRLTEQVRRLGKDGFDFQNANGLLNMFGYWHSTKGNLIPEHLLEIQPPSYIGMPTDELLKPRLKAARLRGLTIIPYPDGSTRIMERMDRSDEAGLRPVFIDASEIDNGALVGAVVAGPVTYWIESRPPADSNRDWRYRVWNAVLEWMDGVGDYISSRHPGSFSPRPRLVSLEIPDSRVFEDIAAIEASKVALADTIAVEPQDTGARVTIKPDWLAYLRTPANIAEVELISAIVTSFSAGSKSPLDIAQIRPLVRAAVGSSDWRQIHARELFRPEDRLSAAGLSYTFRPVPFSAHTLARCRSVWLFRRREEGNEIDGLAACRQFIFQYHDALLKDLIEDIRRFDRTALCLSCGRRYQSSRTETARWRHSIRALRAIRGGAADATAFDRLNESNAVQRGSKIIAELAACEAPGTGGLIPSRAEVDNLFAKALLIFGNTQLLSSIEFGLIPAKIRISPAGDLLIDRTVSLDIVRPSAQWQNRQALNDADRAYGKREAEDEDDTGKRKELDPALRKATEAEYQASAEAVYNLQFAVIDLAAERKEGVFVARRSELAALLKSKAYGSDTDFEPLLARLTLPTRASWDSLGPDMHRYDIDLGRFDRPWSLINRPLLALTNDADPMVLVAPMMISDATMYCASGLLDGALNNDFWVSAEARSYAGAKGKESGDKFETLIAERVQRRGLRAIPRCQLSNVLNQKVPPELGDIDVLVISADNKRVWALEAKHLRICRTEAEAAARMSDYLGRTKTNRKGKEEPDKMLRHTRRVEYLRAHRQRLSSRLPGVDNPEVHGLLVVNSPQPMNFRTIDDLPDGRAIFLDELDTFEF